MGWRFKKPINFGGFRLNLSKKGLGLSWGFPMFRTGISADGRRYIWITIPRTGLSWVKYFGKPSVSAQQTIPPPSPTNPYPPSVPINTPQSSSPGSAPSSSSTPWWKQKNIP
ncbi:MAG TPA: DUF4236 domain-containing protein [Candidatus Dormibacteraeota bacterium]|nr:DUF4236 domain-containing protein [Candidatus Dormibacteraeota bacterium]